MIKFPKPKFQIGDKVWVNANELGVAPFEATVYEVRFNPRYLYGSTISSRRAGLEYSLFEDEEYKVTSDGWTEDMLSISYPR